MSRLQAFVSDSVTTRHRKFEEQVAVTTVPSQVVASLHSALVSEEQSDAVAQQRTPGSEARQHTPLLQPLSHCSLVVQREPSLSFAVHFPPLQTAFGLHWLLEVHDCKQLAAVGPEEHTASTNMPQFPATMPAHAEGSATSVDLH
jgi:hypothetical protein